MFPAQASDKVGSASRSLQSNAATPSDSRTSIAVVNRIAKGLLEASPGQASLNHYVNLQFGIGQRASYSQSLWLGLRKLSRQMKMIEQQAIKANRPMNEKDCERAAFRVAEYLDSLLKNLKEDEVNHPSFRKELIEHLENMISWHPKTPHVWIMVGKSLRPGEYIQYKNLQFDSDRCHLMVQHMFAQVQRLRSARHLSAMRAGQV